jgi:2-keto-3-deoxy-L-rhamnonate aldolase RhmA
MCFSGRILGNRRGSCDSSTTVVCRHCDSSASGLDAMRTVAASCRRHGKWWGTLGIGREHYQMVKGLGAQLICPGGDVRVMLNGVRELAKTFQEPA